jgi:hypothetical protein
MARDAGQHFRDGRRHGWFPVYKSATERIRAHFAGRPNGLTTATALAVYGAVLELLNDARAEEGPVYRRALAEAAGIGLKAATRYQDELEACGVIRVERRQIEGVNLPNIVRTVDTDRLEPLAGVESSGPDGVGASGPDGGVERTPGVGSSGLEGSGREDTPNEEALTTTSSALEEEREETRSRAVSLAGDHEPVKSFTYKSKTVPAAVRRAAVDALAEFSSATGKSIRLIDGTGGPSPELRQIAGAMLTRPDVPLEDWKAAIRATVASPPSWVDGPLQVGHVFGERAAAHTLAAGRGEAPAANGNGHRRESDAVVAAARAVAGGVQL